MCKKKWKYDSYVKVMKYILIEELKGKLQSHFFLLTISFPFKFIVGYISIFTFGLSRIHFSTIPDPLGICFQLGSARLYLRSRFQLSGNPSWWILNFFLLKDIKNHFIKHKG